MAAKKTTNTPAKKRGRPKRTKEAKKAIRKNALEYIGASGISLRQKNFLEFLVFGDENDPEADNSLLAALQKFKVDPRTYFFEWRKLPQFIETEKVINHMIFEKLNQLALGVAADGDAGMLRYMLDKKGAILKEEGYTAVPIQVQAEPIKIEFHTPVPDRNIFTDDND